METIYYTATETAKMIRAELKVKFPGVKFSVRKSSSSCIWVSFNGTHLMGDLVNATVQNFRGADFDGMTDSESTTYHELHGDRVHFGSRYIFLDVDTTGNFCLCARCERVRIESQVA